MTSELVDALAVLAAQVNGPMTQAELAAALLAVYPPKLGESQADALCRLQDELGELFEGLIGTVQADG